MVNNIIELSPANPFKQDDLGALVNEIATNSVFYEYSEEVNTILERIKHSNREGTEPLLQEIYKCFGCTRDNFIQTWQRYP